MTVDQLGEIFLTGPLVGATLVDLQFSDSLNSYILCLSAGLAVVDYTLTNVKSAVLYVSPNYIASCAYDAPSNNIWVEVRGSSNSLTAYSASTLHTTDTILFNTTVCAPASTPSVPTLSVSQNVIYVMCATSAAYANLSSSSPVVTGFAFGTNGATVLPFGSYSFVPGGYIVQKFYASNSLMTFSSVSSVSSMSPLSSHFTINSASGTLYWLLPFGTIGMYQLGTSASALSAGTAVRLPLSAAAAGSVFSTFVDPNVNRFFVFRFGTITASTTLFTVDMYGFGACNAAATSCSQCISGNDFECGWCATSATTGSCSTAANCTSPLAWFQDTCPILTGVTPTTQLVTGLPFVLQLSATLFNTPGYTVACQLVSSGTGQIVPLDVIASPSPLCGINAANSTLLPTIAGSYQVEVIAQGYAVASSPQSVTFLNCSTLTTCSSCTSASSYCNWCVYDGLCVNTATTCSRSGAAFTRPTAPSNCPVQGPVAPNSTIVPVPSNSIVTINSTSLITPTSSSYYRCQFQYGSSLTPAVTSGSYIDQNTIQCPVPSPPTGFLGVANLSVVFNGHPYADAPNTFNYYDCTSSQLSTCALCVTPNNANCAWNTATSTCAVYNASGSADLVTTCPTITAAAPTSFYYTATGLTMTLTATYFTPTSPTAWICSFANVSTSIGTWVSTTQLTCPVPVFAPTSYFTSGGTNFPSLLTVLHNGAAYLNTINTNWYSCGGTSCSTCLLNGMAPACGWMTGPQTCGLSASGALSSCPLITSASDTAGQLSGNLSLVIDAQQAPEATFSYRCAWINFSNASIPALYEDATIDGNGWSCTTPSLANYSTHTVTSSLQIQVDPNSGVWVPYTTNSVGFTFLDCHLLTSCSTCLVSSQCYWVNHTACATSASAGLDPFHGACPTVLAVSPLNLRIQIPTQQVTLSVANFPTTNNWSSYQCRFSVAGTPAPIYSSVVQLNQSALQCTFTQTYSGLPTQTLPVDVVAANLTKAGSLVGITNDTVSMSIYDCTSASTCDSCSLVSSLCGWCSQTASCTDSGTCLSTPSNTWTRNLCPYVDSTTPPYAAIGHASSLTWTGGFTGNVLSSILCRYNQNNALLAMPTTVNTTTIVCPLANLAGLNTLSANTFKVDLVQQLGGNSSKRATSYSSYVSNVVSFDIFSCQAPSVNNQTNCDLCAGAAGATIDSRCGWCAYDAYCADFYSCDTEYSNYIASSTACPAVLGLNPATGPLAGGTTITVTGNLFFPNAPLTTSCSFNNQVVPAIVDSNTTVTCISPRASLLGVSSSNTPVTLSILWNGEAFATSSSIRFTYKNTDNTATIALATVLPIVGVILLVVLILFVVFYRKIMEKREASRFLKLREPDYAKVAFSQTKSIDFVLTPADVKALRKFVRILEADEKFTILAAFAQCAPGSQADHLARSAVYFYQSRFKALDMLTTFVSAEVKASEHEGTLFRSTSFACKLFNQYARYAGLPYLWRTLGYFVNQLAEFAKDERVEERDDILGPGTMEVDPDRFEDEAEAPTDVEVRANQYELLTRASKILKAIFSSLPNMRPEFRELCSRVKHEVSVKFPDNNADFKAVGGFIFLRFICPSIMAPHIYGLLENPPNEVAQRYFVLLSKSLQNLANETLPGTNEDFMARMNQFITQNIEPLHMWINRLCHLGEEEQPEPNLPIPDDLQNSSVAFMQHLLVDEWDNVIKHLPEDLITQLEPIREKSHIGKKPKAAAKKAARKPRE